MNIGIDIDNTLTNTSIVSNTLVKQDILYRGANDYHDLDKEDKKDIYLYINSPGGAVTSGLAIYDTIKFINSNVITIGMGLCASMGAFLLSSGDKRYALENTEIMIHEVLGGFEGSARNIKLQSERINKIKEKINKIMAKNTKKTIKQIEKDTGKDYYMSSKEAKEYGIIDDIIKK